MSSEASSTGPGGAKYPPARLSWRWVLLVTALLIANLLLLSLVQPVSIWIAFFFVFSVAVAFSRGPCYHYRRFVYYLVVPFLLTLVVVNRVLYDVASLPVGWQVLPSLAAASPNARAAWSLAIGALAGLAVVALIIGTYVILNQYYIAAFTGLDHGAARRILFSLLFNFNYPYLLVRNGDWEVLTKWAGILGGLGGPGILIVQPGNAVVMHSGGKITRVEAGGIVMPRSRFETILRVVNLAPRDNGSKPAVAELLAAGTASEKKERNTPNVLTSDRISLDMDVVVFFNIKRRQPPPEIDPPLVSQATGELQASAQTVDAYPVDKEDILRAATKFSNWENAVPAIAQAKLRDIVGQHSLDKLFEVPENDDRPRLRGQVCDEVRRLTNEIVEGDGVTITQVAISEIDLPSQISELARAQWLAQGSISLAQTRREVARVNSKSEAETLEHVHAARARAQAMLLSQIAEGLRQSGSVGQASKDLLLWLRFMESLEVIAKHPSTKLLFPYGLPFKSTEAMRQLSELDAGQTSLYEGPHSEIPDAFREFEVDG